MPIVRDILAKKGHHVFTITKDLSVLDAARSMNEQHVGALCVVEGECLVGIFSERDVLTRVVAQQRDPAGTKVEEVMTSPVVTCGPEGKISDCVAVMSSRKIRHLPVVEGGSSCRKLVGVISTGDLMALDVDQKQAQIEHLHEYLHGRS